MPIHRSSIAVSLPLALMCLLGTSSVSADTTLTVEPTTLRQIKGIGELDRQTVFNLCDPGKGFDQRIDSEERMVYLLRDLNITFGRQLGPVNSVTNWGGGVDEYKQRPGFADVEALARRLDPPRPGDLFRRLSRGRLDVAAHGSHNAYPEFMGVVTTDAASEAHKPQRLPENILAAAELAATVMDANYSDFDRPRYYEPVNEPHWSFISGQHIADWHLATQRAVQSRTPDVMVGGPCHSVAYYYKRNFDAFNGLRDFMDNTGGQLDFYSYHVYDYLRYIDGEVQGRVSTGLPMEGVMDLVQSYAVNTFGRECPIVISEHGGYFLPGSSDMGVEAVAKAHLPAGSGFEHEMKVRSIASHALVSSCIANTLTFMDHPHVVKKAVPFILLESMQWDPRYYSTAFVARNFTDFDDWVESANLDFFKFFRDLEGHRVLVTGLDPDVQAQAFVDGKKVRVVLNNLSPTPQTVSLDLPEGGDLRVRRYARNDDYTPSLTEEALASLDEIELAGREAVLVTATYGQRFEAERRIDEVPFYAKAIQVKPEGERPARFVVKIDDADLDGAAYATLRVGMVRPPGATPTAQVLFNGKRLRVPVQDSVDRYTNQDEFATTLLIPVETKHLKKHNTILLGFPDKQGGAFGTAVIRVGFEQ